MGGQACLFFNASCLQSFDLYCMFVNSCVNIVYLCVFIPILKTNILLTSSLYSKLTNEHVYICYTFLACLMSASLTVHSYKSLLISAGHRNYPHSVHYLCKWSFQCDSNRCLCYLPHWTISAVCTLCFISTPPENCFLFNISTLSTVIHFCQLSIILHKRCEGSCICVFSALWIMDKIL